jgi:hypothetical protein
MKGAQLGQALVSLKSIRLDRKGSLPVTYTLAYFSSLSVTTFGTLTTGV